MVLFLLTLGLEFFTFLHYFIRDFSFCPRNIFTIVIVLVPIIIVVVVIVCSVVFQCEKIVIFVVLGLSSRFVNVLLYLTSEAYIFIIVVMFIEIEASGLFVLFRTLTLQTEEMSIGIGDVSTVLAIRLFVNDCFSGLCKTDLTASFDGF